jgi:hypothetical protein
MEDGIQSSLHIHTITNLRAAECLSDPKQLVYLSPFIARNLSAGEAATEIGCTLSVLYGKVQRFLDLGLLKVVAQIPRKGRAIKVYRSSADHFFVPGNVVNPLEGKAIEDWDDFWTLQFQQATVRAIESAGEHLGNHIFRDQAGILTLNVGSISQTIPDFRPPNLPALVTLLHDDLQLEFSQAKQLQAELYTLFEKYKPTRGGQRYLLRLNLVPALEGTDLLR